MNTFLFFNIGTGDIIFLLFLFIVGLTPLLLAIGALIDLFKRDFAHASTDRILLTLLIIFAPIIGSLVYLIILRKNYKLKNYYEKVRI